MIGENESFQVEEDQATSTRNVSSSKRTWLWVIGFASGCFALGVACACLVLHRAWQAPVSAAANGDLGFNPPMVRPLRQNPATHPQIQTPSNFRPKASRASTVTMAEPPTFSEYMRKREDDRLNQRKEIMREAFPPPDPQLVKTPPESGQSFVPTAYRTSTATSQHANSLKPYGGYDPKDKAAAPARKYKPYGYGGYDPSPRPAAPQSSAAAKAEFSVAPSAQEPDLDFYEFMRKRDAESES